MFRKIKTRIVNLMYLKYSAKRNVATVPFPTVTLYPPRGDTAENLRTVNSGSDRY
jgi:hypothetical protein